MVVGVLAVRETCDQVRLGLRQDLHNRPRSLQFFPISDYVQITGKHRACDLYTQLLN
ncbi:hypothetical protein MiSe_58700 [Microseira wollei NIES-4236]|uniref:Transposase n=1 Tax=Microseira wollei NIES-4236 TaxID=2530354 RepID=A0AAV3XFM9_9CYAN|nr:hypothetical protein MiSe_58700 [Microseira wollei NIES-4236]